MPKCIPIECSDSRSSSSSDESHYEKRVHPKHRPDTEQYLQLVQGIILQTNLTIEKYARWFAEEIRQRLIAGVGKANKHTLERIKCDTHELEKRIIKIICHYNEEIERELLELVTNTNADLQDSIIELETTSTAGLIASLTAAATLTVVAPIQLVIDVTIGNPIVNTFVLNLITDLERLFRRVTAQEIAAANKIIEDKLHNQLRDIEKLLCDFERRIENYFKELGIETASLVTLIINNSTRKFISHIEDLIKKLGNNVICILQGNRNEYKKTVIVKPTFHREDSYECIQ
ncbi:uncharacterized protein VNE69_11141 [Vairimorpha necatrix]|uniref:Uncharacterized protein n=1 Tax=Vairimorpha necatrix TaxID=6039 RepID=A0AAX4JGM5_9MICR